MNKLYRVPYGFWHERHTTIQDVINHEKITLGNADLLQVCHNPSVLLSHANHCCWVALDIETAREYLPDDDFNYSNDNIEVIEPDNILVILIGQDNDLLIFYPQS